MKKEKSRNIWSSLSILSAAKLKIFQKPVAVDAEGGDKEHYGKLRELHPSSPVSRLSYFKLGFFFSLYVNSDMKKKLLIIPYSLKRMVTDSI